MEIDSLRSNCYEWEIPFGINEVSPLKVTKFDSHHMRFLTMWYVGPATAHTSLGSLIRAFVSLLNIL